MDGNLEEHQSAGEPSSPEMYTFSDDFTMVPYKDETSWLPKLSTGAITTLIISGIILLGSLYLLFVSSDSVCPDAQCKVAKAMMLGGSMFGLFISGLLAVTAVAWSSSAARRQKSENRKEQEFLAQYSKDTLKDN